MKTKYPNIRKKIISELIFFHLRVTLLLFLLTFTKNMYSQNTFSNNQYTLWGEFVVIKAYIPGMSAMNNNETKLWIGKHVEFHDSVYLQIDNQSIYKNDFEFAQCIKRKSYALKKYSINEFYESYKYLPKEIGITEQNVKYISLEDCTGTPFSEILIKSNGNLIIGWDGAQFELMRLKRY